VPGWWVLPLVQGVYYVVTGIWPVISIRTFEAVTGPKTDHWLVQTLGLLITAVGSVLIVAALRRRLMLEIGLLACGSAAALGGAGSYFALREQIRPIYLVDGFVELVIIALWVAAGLHFMDGEHAP
jgi:hypothetical protein